MNLQADYLIATDKEGYRAARRIRLGAKQTDRFETADPVSNSAPKAAVAAVTTSALQPPNDVSDFIFGASSPPRSEMLGDDEQFAMSGGLGIRSATAPLAAQSDDWSPNNMTSRPLPIRKRRGDYRADGPRATYEAGKRIRRSDAEEPVVRNDHSAEPIEGGSLPSVLLIDNASVKPELETSSAFARSTSGSTISQLQRKLFPDFDESDAVVVFSDERFEPGSLDEGQMWYIFKRCERANQLLLYNVFKNVKHDKKLRLRLSFADFMSRDCTAWLNKDIIPFVGLPRKIVLLDDN